MQGEAWRAKKYVHKRTHHRHPRMSAREKRTFKERMEESKGIRRRERWNAYGSHRNIDITFSPATLAIRKRRGF